MPRAARFDHVLAPERIGPLQLPSRVLMPAMDMNLCDDGAITDGELLWLIDQFAQAARRVREAGGDAVEVHAAHGYVLSTFLAQADNRRIDRWGGSLENRARLTVEVLRAVRTAVGPDMAVLVRVAGREFGGVGALSTEEAAAAARHFEAAGADAIHVIGWGRNSFVNFTDGPLPDTVGAYRAFA